MGKKNQDELVIVSKTAALYLTFFYRQIAFRRNEAFTFLASTDNLVITSRKRTEANAQRRKWDHILFFFLSWLYRRRPLLEEKEEEQHHQPSTTTTNRSFDDLCPAGSARGKEEGKSCRQRATKCVPARRAFFSCLFMQSSIACCNHAKNAKKKKKKQKGTSREHRFQGSKGSSSENCTEGESAGG